MRRQRSYRFEIPEGRVNRVVFRRFSGVGEAVGEHAAIDAGGEGEQDAARDVEATRSQRQPGQRDHRVAAPIAEPGIACNDRAALAAPNDELVGGPHQQLHEGIAAARLGGDVLPPLDLRQAKPLDVLRNSWFRRGHHRRMRFGHQV